MNLYIVAFTLIMSVGANDEAVGPFDPPTTSVKPLPTSVNKTVLLQLVNDVRKKGCKCGDTYYGPAPAVKWNDQLATAAVSHSEDMYKNKFFAHVAPDGSNGGVRVKRAGYPWMAYGENIAAGYTSEKEVVKGWVESPGHCKNIMSKLYKEMGVGRFGNFWTQEFGAR
ncbi:CAP domain-containing protein [Flavisolibacter tropicus]|uniref:CAP domain-containing protein n=1 Tax=Flavisolibacter tropicus TaxID=1492898 RepID=UPI00082D93C6|nr:CAP domain-containing protein [Flavisolibacter tropicus]